MVSDWGNEVGVVLSDAGDGVLESDLTSQVSEKATIGEGNTRRWTGFSF